MSLRLLTPKARAGHTTKIRHARNTHRTLSTLAVAAQKRMWEAEERYGKSSPAARLAERRFKTAHSRVLSAAKRLESLGD